MKKNNRNKILEASTELFNRSGVVAVTTNHIADHLKISPGNLYFHFRNREEIVRELFSEMCHKTYAVWSPRTSQVRSSPRTLLESTYEIFWDYRFFHREMYHLRRKDPLLAQQWHAHINKSIRLLNAIYRRWVKAGLMRQITDPAEMQMIGDCVLMTSSTFMQFFESAEKTADRRVIQRGINHVLRFLDNYAVS